jgi:hypothetical protein
VIAVTATVFGRLRKWKSVVDRRFVRNDSQLAGYVRNVDKQVAPARRLPASGFGDNRFA